MANFNNTIVFPKQRLSYKDKSKNDFQWAKDVIDRLILNYAAYNNGSNTKNPDYKRMLANYRLYNNKLNQEDFESDKNPLGLDVGQYMDEIKPYNKTPNKINVLLGEEIKRPFNFKTILINSEGVKSKLNYKTELLQQFVQAYVQQTIAESKPGYTPDIPMDATVAPEHLEEYMKYTYQDAKEKLANDLLQYLFHKEEITSKKNDGFKHGLLSGYEFTWVGIEGNEAVAKVLNPLGVFYHKSPDTKFIEDGLYAGYRTRMTTSDILDKFGDFLKEEDLKKLERTLQGVGGWGDGTLGKRTMEYYHEDVTDFFMRESLLENSLEEGAYGRARSEDWTVIHVEWKSQQKVGFLKFTNEHGDEEEIIVNEDFVVPEGAKKITVDIKGYKKSAYEFNGMTLYWGWIPQIWEGIKIGQDIYCCMGPKKYQYRSIDNPNRIRLGYHGVIYSAANADPISLMDRMWPYAHLYMIVAHKLKHLIAKDKGQVFHFDLSMVPEQLGLEKTLYYLEHLDVDFYNPLQNAETPGSYQRGKITGATSRSNMQHILHYVQLLAALDEQINDVAGITRQREGQTNATEAVTNAQQNIVQSTSITEAVYFAPHEQHWARVLNSLIECTQVAWKGKSIIRQYVLDDLSTQTLQMESDSLVNADFGVFVTNSAKDNELFNSMKQLAQPLLQNDKAKFSDILLLLKADSVRELETRIIESEERRQQEMLEQIQAQQEAQQQQIEAQMQMKEREMQHEIELQQMKDAAALEREMVKGVGFARDNDLNKNEIPDALEYEKFREEMNLKYTEMKHQKDENEKDRKSKEKIANINARKSQNQSKK